MLPLTGILFGSLIIFLCFVFPNRKVEFLEEVTQRKPKKSLFVISMVLLIIYTILLEMRYVYPAFIFVSVVYLAFYRTVFLKTDWMLLPLLAVIFIDFHVISTIPIVLESMNRMNLHNAGNVFLVSTITSQLVSNVPASVLISKFSHNWLAITYGVNVGGNGLIIGSIANVIALRMAKSRGIHLNFHRYSIFYFLITAGIVYFLFYAI